MTFDPAFLFNTRTSLYWAKRSAAADLMPTLINAAAYGDVLKNASTLDRALPIAVDDVSPPLIATIFVSSFTRVGFLVLETKQKEIFRKVQIKKI